ncbi:MAG: endonuclease III [Chlamydiae bacterium SM23_39]|nr:MAG: endonuclease III [Chlamydiae bacterium SM23_39]
MNKKTSFIIKTLNRYFPNPKIFLKYKNRYTLLISVLLSSQSTDKIVNKITPILFCKADSPKKMLKLSFSEIEKIIKPCGLSKIKTKAILELSKILVERYSSKVPNTFKSLESLPRVGHKTASVVLAFGFGKFTFPVDTHIRRCAIRWELTKKKSSIQIEKDLKRIFPKKYWKKLHLQIIYFARKFCKAKGHKIDKCPICSKINNLS